MSEIRLNVHASDNEFGTVNWVLPPGISEKIATCDPDDELFLLETIEAIFRLQLTNVIAALNAGASTSQALSIIIERAQRTRDELLGLNGP